jgi:hypothetical protein
VQAAAKLFCLLHTKTSSLQIAAALASLHDKNTKSRVVIIEHEIDSNEKIDTKKHYYLSMKRYSS